MRNEVIIISGPNSSGKTTYASDFLKKYKYEFVNADDIAQELNRSDLGKARIKAGKIFLRKVAKMIKDNKNFALETTFR